MTTYMCLSPVVIALWFAQNSLPLWLKWQPFTFILIIKMSCDLLKIHYLCGWNDNVPTCVTRLQPVVICSKFITFVVEMTTKILTDNEHGRLWFAQNSLPLWLKWQRSHVLKKVVRCCDLLKIHYLCGWNDNFKNEVYEGDHVVICSKFITFVVEMTTKFGMINGMMQLWFAQNSLPLWLKWQHKFYIRLCIR